MNRGSDQRGAAAVEFAIVSMLLVVLLMGIMEFGYAFFLQGNIAGAAREAARTYAVSGDLSEPERSNAAIARAEPLPEKAKVLVGTCGAGEPVTVVIEYQYSGLTGFFGSLTLRGQGKMRCGG